MASPLDSARAQHLNSLPSGFYELLRRVTIRQPLGAGAASGLQVQICHFSVVTVCQPVKCLLIHFMNNQMDGAVGQATSRVAWWVELNETHHNQSHNRGRGRPVSLFGSHPASNRSIARVAARPLPAPRRFPLATWHPVRAPPCHHHRPLAAFRLKTFHRRMPPGNHRGRY